MSQALHDPMFLADGAPIAHEEATRIWRELALGQWQILAAVDTEGTRHVAIAPATKPPIQWEVLRYRERQVLALAARGTSLKFIAAELGFTSVAALLRAYEANESRSER